MNKTKIVQLGAGEIMDWQPIETAPKDGSYVLLFFPVRGVMRGRWNNDAYATKPRPYWRHDLEPLYGTREVRKYQPTHWMPLPPPPSQAVDC